MGFELGHGGDLKERIKELPKRALFVPLLGGVGAVLGGAVAVGLLLNVSAGTSALVAACFGWYSMPSVIIAQTYDLTVGTLALLTNVFREVLAIVLIPWIAKKFGPLPAVASGGATSLDVTLPIISQSTDVQTALIAIYSGSVLSGIVPLLVPLVIKILEQVADGRIRIFFNIRTLSRALLAYIDIATAGCGFASLHCLRRN